MPKQLIFILLTLLSCDGSDESPGSTSLRLASMWCGKNPSELQWLQDLIERSQTDPSLMGNIYVGKYDGNTVFVHQPMIMSCMACMLYDCEGNRLDPSTIGQEKMSALINGWRLVHSPYRES